jgi:hypothetical protein
VLSTPYAWFDARAFQWTQSTLGPCPVSSIAKKIGGDPPSGAQATLNSIYNPQDPSKFIIGEAGGFNWVRQMSKTQSQPSPKIPVRKTGLGILSFVGKPQALYKDKSNETNTFCNNRI